MLCKGKNRGTGRPCKANAILGRQFCRVHGGKVPRGVAHPNFRHGRRSKDLVANLQERYEEALSDGKILDLTDEIALADAYIAEVLKSGESGKRWKDVDKALAALEAARSGDAAAVASKLRAMRKVVEEGVEDWAHRDEVMRRLDQRRRLVESENRRRSDSRFALTHEEMLASVAAVVDIMTTRIKDRALLRLIMDDIDGVIRRIEGDHSADADRN